MNCAECRYQLLGYLEGLIDPDLSSQIDAHVATCPPCREELAALRQVQGQLQRDGQAPSGVSLESAVMDRIVNRQTLQRRKSRMRNRILAWSAAAAAVLALPLVLMIVIGKTANTAYALEQTVAAVRTVTTVHLKCDPPANGAAEIWIQFDEAGQLQYGRVDFPASQDGPKVVILKRDVAEVWLKAKNSLLTLREPKAVAGLEAMIGQLDPKQVVEQLYKAQAEGKDDIKIEPPAAKGDPITVTRTTHRDSQERRDVFLVDPETKLLRQLDRYVREGESYTRVSGITIVGYNQPIDPTVFAPELPADVMRIDWTTQQVGLAQGDLSREDIAAKVAREFFEALIARDYAKAGLLYSGIPAAKLQEGFGAVTFVRIVSIGVATPDANPMTGFLNVPCEVVVKEAGGDETARKFVAKVRPVHGQPGRWAIDGGI
jgi:hypothetical protein